MMRIEERARPATAGDLEPGMTAQLADDGPWLTVDTVTHTGTRTRVLWHGRDTRVDLSSVRPITILARIKVWR